MSVIRSAVNKPVTTALVFLAFAIFGVYSLINTSVAQFPDFDANVVMVMSSYPGTLITIAVTAYLTYRWYRARHIA